MVISERKYLQEANLYVADLQEANLYVANLEKAPDLSFYQLSKVKTLYAI